MTLAYVGLGANLGDPRRTLAEAILELGHLVGCAVTRQSSLYRCAPLGTTAQADFINAVVGLETTLEAELLLDQLQAIENRHGRQRPFSGAPRTLDLDLLLYGDVQLSTPRLTVPHPRMHERAFVLQPLLELDPVISLPVKGLASVLLRACSGQKIARIE
ncbi:MAG: 2-amino-4-hydroxy-6-hydroxymethyldihydropteridine diphosphokinase [Betaproteobacteria bacterium]|nr:2-amino-4-hydroxy-6-hydroxymethyldihydropteridine diphosphokinase [Betaproteobacteria bacterium]